MRNSRIVTRPSFRPKISKGKNTFAKKKQPIAEDYGENWELLRDHVLRRDNYTCQAVKVKLPRCNLRFPPPFQSLLHVHHIIPLPKGPNHPSNLVLLCRDCHGKVHNKYLGSISDKQRKIGRRST